MSGKVSEEINKTASSLEETFHTSAKSQKYLQRLPAKGFDEVRLLLSHHRAQLPYLFIYFIEIIMEGDRKVQDAQLCAVVGRGVFGNCVQRREEAHRDHGSRVRCLRVDEPAAR